MHHLPERHLRIQTKDILVSPEPKFYGASNGDIRMGGTKRVSDLGGPKIWSDFEKIRQKHNTGYTWILFLTYVSFLKSKTAFLIAFVEKSIDILIQTNKIQVKLTLDFSPKAVI